MRHLLASITRKCHLGALLYIELDGAFILIVQQFRHLYLTPLTILMAKERMELRHDPIGSQDIRFLH